MRRRFYRFFQHVELDGAMTARVVAELLGMGGKPWVLAMDRTNWDFGKTTINILMISVIWNGVALYVIVRMRSFKQLAALNYENDIASILKFAAIMRIARAAWLSRACWRRVRRSGCGFPFA